MLRIIGDTNINFIGLRYKAFIISGLVIIIGLVAFIMILMGKGNMGLDFVGGTMVQGNFEQPVSIADLRDAVAAGGFPEASIQELHRHNVPNFYIIRVKEITASDMKAADRIVEIVKEHFPQNAFTKDSEHTIGPAVGDSLRKSARWAILISVLGMLVYLWFRFDLRSGVAATVATIHDVLFVLGMFWIMDKEISLLVVTSLLTLAGYSLTDKVVVFDRIREKLKKFKLKAEYVGAINKSINEVLSRTLMTGLTVLLVILIMLIFGGEVLYDFSLALFVGIVVGTYSSIFVACMMLVEWEARSPRRAK